MSFRRPSGRLTVEGTSAGRRRVTSASVNAAASATAMAHGSEGKPLPKPAAEGAGGSSDAAASGAGGAVAQWPAMASSPSISAGVTALDAGDALAVEALREYLRIPSVHPDVDYGPCEQWVRAQAADLDLPVRVERPSKPHKPVLIVTWTGSQPDAPSIVLNSHMDVVPVYEAEWQQAPFGGARTEDGRLWGRGAQDMKGVAVQYLAAVRRLRRAAFCPRRSLHLVFVPDEEIGGSDGMEAFVRTQAFADLNVGFALDEGMPWPGPEFVLFNAERSNWKVEFVCRGTPGHGSLLMANPAVEKVRAILNRLLDFRAEQKAMITEPVQQGNVTAVNVTLLQGGVLNNVVPPEMSIIADVRISVAQDHDEFVKMLQGWCDEAGDTELRILTRGEVEGVTELNDSNIWWKTFKAVMDDMNQKIIPVVCPGGTDARLLRRMNIPAFGISLMNNTPLLLHDHDEYLDEKVFLRGITIYEELLRKLTAL